MSRRESRRVLVFAIIVVLASILAGAWFQRFGRRATPEQRAREKAEELKERVRELTH